MKFQLTNLCYLALLLSITSAHAQVAINTDGSEPDGSAILDISSMDKGLLIPRMDSTARIAIDAPAEGLMVFDSTTNSFWYYTDNWNQITSSTFKFPASDGDSLQVLATDGGGNLSWADNYDYQSLSFQNDSLSISNGGDPIDLSDLRTQLDTNGLSVRVLAEEIVTDIVQEEFSSSAAATNMWQSFTPNYSGFLTQLDLRLENSFNTGEFRIRKGEGTSGELVIFVDDISLPTGQWGSLDLEEYSIYLEQDEVYTFIIKRNDAGAFATKRQDSNVYDGGRSNGCSGTCDYPFRTYMRPAQLDAEIIQIQNDNADYSINLNSIDTLSFTDGSFQNTAFPNPNSIASQALVTDNEGALSWVNISEVDDQSIDVLNLNGSTLEISLEGDGEDTHTLDLSSLAPIGTIQMWPTSSAPDGWLICDGSSFSTATYPDLEGVLGGSTLPDFSGRFPLGVGNSGTSGSTSHSLSSTGGEETHVLTINEMPSHSHGIRYQGRDKSGNGSEVSDLTGSTETDSTQSTGGGQAHNNMPPYYTINFIIKAE